MKVTIEIDATPQEMRTLMGLPDIEPLQREIMEKMRERTLASIDATDPTNFLKLFMPTADHFKSVEALQTSFWDAIGKGMDFSGKPTKDKE